MRSSRDAWGGDEPRLVVLELPVAEASEPLTDLPPRIGLHAADARLQPGAQFRRGELLNVNHQVIPGVVAARRAGQAPARDLPHGHLARLAQEFDRKPTVAGSGGRAAAAVPGLVEQLTGRELEVLAMLAKGTPNQAIAEDVFVTLFTVKGTSATS